MQIFPKIAYTLSTNLLLATTELSNYFCLTLVYTPAFSFKPS